MRSKKRTKNKHTDRNAVSELVFAIQHAIQTEFHLVESMAMNNEDVKAVDELTAVLIQVRQLRTSLMTSLAEASPAVNGIWCVFKHLFAMELHLFELYEKTNETIYLERIESTHVLIDDLLCLDHLSNMKECPICDEERDK